MSKYTNPRAPRYGQALGPGGGISADVYESFAPQMARTEYMQEDMLADFQFKKDVFDEEQAQLDAKIAQAKYAEDLRKKGIQKEKDKQMKGRKVQAAVQGGTMGATFGVPGAIIGTLAGAVFGNEGGYVPEIHPRSMLFKEYQQGGTVTGYKGEGKFGRRGLQNLQMREEDLGRLRSNVDKMGRYGFYDAAMDAVTGYTRGKRLSGFTEGLKTGLGDMKNFGIKDAIKMYAARSGGLGDVGELLETFTGFDQDEFMQDAIQTMSDNVTRLGREQNPFLQQEETQSLLDFLPESPKVVKSPARNAVLNKNAGFKKAFRQARKDKQDVFTYNNKLFNTRLG